MSRLLAAQRGRCFYCEGELVLRQFGEPPSPLDATIDHFFPLALGGPDSWGNWVLACSPCNHAKADRAPEPSEVARWNTLAGEWPYIRAIDAAYVQQKRCVACRCWISPMRLEASVRSGKETETCRRRCSQRLRRERQRQRGFRPDRAMGGPSRLKRSGKLRVAAQMPGLASGLERRVPWWKRLRAVLHTLLRRMGLS